LKLDAQMDDVGARSNWAVWHAAASVFRRNIEGAMLTSTAADTMPTSPVSWATLGSKARAWRMAHAIWSVVQMTGLGYIWASAISGRRSPRVWAFVALLLAEGAALVVGRGNCPMGNRQTEWGDPVPFFELLLPPRAAKAAVPLLAVITVGAIATLLLRRPGLVARA
jgi:hypothetical protein